jgi:acyl CoA:acetate/3-ketoacid CoA transferase beta subunit
MKLRLLILFLSLCYVPANAQMTKEKIIVQQNLNEVKSDRFYITAIANENSLEDLKNKIKKKFDVDISFKKLNIQNLIKSEKLRLL